MEYHQDSYAAKAKRRSRLAKKTELNLNEGALWNRMQNPKVLEDERAGMRLKYKAKHEWKTYTMWLLQWKLCVVLKLCRELTIHLHLPLWISLKRVSSLLLQVVWLPKLQTRSFNWIYNTGINEIKPGRGHSINTKPNVETGSELWS